MTEDQIEELYFNDDTKSLSIIDDNYEIEKNNEIITNCNDLLLERIKYKDPSLKLSDITSAKAEAFKQNQLLKNRATENVNININELQNKTPSELYDLLLQLD